MILPECRELWDGVEGADSLVVNPHKWLGVSFDCSTYFVRDPQFLVRVMSTNPSYLQTAADGAGEELPRLGLAARAPHARAQVVVRDPRPGRERPAGAHPPRSRATRMAGRRDRRARRPGELLAPVRLQTLVRAPRAAGLDAAAIDAHTRAWAQAVNESGEAFLTPAVIDGQLGRARLDWRGGHPTRTRGRSLAAHARDMAATAIQEGAADDEESGNCDCGWSSWRCHCHAARARSSPRAQQTPPAPMPAPADVKIETMSIAPGIYMLVGRGGNVGLTVGVDGAAIIDDQFADMAPKIRAAVAMLSDKPVHFVINTHLHGDHTGGNDALRQGRRGHHRARERAQAPRARRR